MDGHAMIEGLAQLAPFTKMALMAGGRRLDESWLSTAQTYAKSAKDALGSFYEPEQLNIDSSGKWASSR